MRVRDLIKILSELDPDLPVLGYIDDGIVGELWAADVSVCEDYRPPVPGTLDWLGKQSLEWDTSLTEGETDEQRPKTRAVVIR